ncbi:MAG: DUF5011 domain-containing protein [Myxococcaceae bacterium]|nr:DUF5011 domain-containing protein [Myxococcaceae bacterium]
MAPKALWRALLLAAALTAVSCHEESGEPVRAPTPATVRTKEQEARSTNKVLILSSSVSGGTSSREAQAAFLLGYPVAVVTPAQWSAMTAEQFMEYRAILIGDAACQGGTSAFQAAADNSQIWGAIIDGNIVIVGADPTTNSTPELVESAVAFALRKQTRTGMYVALGCAYKDALPGTPVPLLAPFGDFEVAGVACADKGHVFAMGPDETLTQFLWDGVLPGNGCAARTVFTRYPSNTLAIAALGMNSSGAPLPGQQPYTDYITHPGEIFVGTPYILARGAMAWGAGCGIDGPTEGESCDLGDGLNGRAALPGQDPLETCSYSCQLNWCGDGSVDVALGEECDNGSLNGRTQDTSGSIGTCSSFCKIPQLASPPDAICMDVTVAAVQTCGAEASINNGSSDPDDDLVGCTQSPAGPYAIGTTAVTLTCVDSQGKSDSCTGTVTVTDGVVPTIALNGPAIEAVECTAGGTYADSGATASDLCEGDLTNQIVKTGAVAMGTPGPYTLSYDVTDSAGNSPDAVTRAVTVRDTLTPTLTLNGLANQGLECGTAFVDPGASASDQCVGNLTAAIVKNGAVNHQLPGSYPITYNVKDPSNNAATEVSRVVTVSDTRKPVVTINGSPSMEVECGDGTYAEPGATAVDACAGLLPAVPGATVNSRLPGAYTIGYSATDPSGNVGTSPSDRTVVVSDTLPPVLSLKGETPQQLECGSPYTEPGVTASDQCAGELTSAISQTGIVDSDNPGRYTLTYTVRDPTGNSAPPATRTINVTDTLPPALTVLGPLEQQYECGSTYVDPGATAMDVCAKDVSSAIVATRTGDPSRPGSFTISYSVTDPSGNRTDSPVTRTVTVADGAPPVLALNGQAIVGLECGTAYTDPGATAMDACFGDVTHLIQRTGTWDNRTPGSYTLTYNVMDPAGHSAPPVTRAISVVDTLAPTLTIRGPFQQLVECGTPYTDPGVTAADLCVGDLTAAIVATGTVDTAVPGSYTRTYSVMDPSGYRAIASRGVTVRDTLPPEIQMNPGPTIIQCGGTPYVDPGATASDLCAGDLTPNILVTSTVNTSVPGQYTVTYSVADGAGNAATAVRPVTVQGIRIRLSDYNLFLLGDYSGGRDVQGKVAVGGNLTMTDFAVGAGLPDNDISRTLVAGGNLSLARGGIWGDARYGGTYSAGSSVIQHRGTMAQGTPVDFAARFAELRSMSTQLNGLTANGTATRETWGGITITGTNPNLNVVHVNASIFTGAKLLAIDAPANSLVVINIHGTPGTLAGFGYSFTGGITERGVLHNFVDATNITAQGFSFWGTVLAPYAHLDFTNGSFDGGIYALSMTGNGEGHISPLPDSEVCQ